MYRFALLLAVAVWTTVEGQIWESGQCPESKNDPPRVAFNLKLLRQILTERSSFNNYLFDRDDAVCSGIFTFSSTGTDINCYYVQTYDTSGSVHSFETRLGTMYLNDPAYVSDHIMNTRFDQIKGGQRDVTIPLELIASDGENYGVLYSCREKDGQRLQMAIVYTAKKNDDSYDEKIKTAVENVGLDYNKFKIAPQLC